MYSINKKKSKLSPAEKNVTQKSYHSRNKSRTENSPTGNRSLSKDQIKSTIKKIVCQNNSKSRTPVNIIKQQPKRSKKLKSRIEISIPNIRSSLTPKSFNNSIVRPSQYGRQAHSTKAADNTSNNNKLFTSSGRYDFKQLFENKNNPHLRDSNRYNSSSHNNNAQGSAYSGQKMTRNQSRIEQKKIQDATIKFHRDDQFDVSAVLTAEQFEKFGDRFPQKFKRIALLGRGGFSVVWLGIHRSSKRKVAVKQILTKNPHETHLKQIWFGSYFFQKGGEPRQEFENHIGINNICKLYSYEIQPLDSWLYYEVCEESLGGCLFQLKGETHMGEKTYKIQYKELIYRMRENISELETLIIQVCKALHLINSHNIVHSDLKTQNILLKLNRKSQNLHSPHTHTHSRSSSTHHPNANNSSSTPPQMIKSVKLIDFGSSFLFTNLKQFSMATPEYMPPQILNYILFQNKLQYDVIMLNKMEKYKNPWVIDIWSLGCIVLEIVTGVPLWMSIPTKINVKIQDKEKEVRATGLFAVKGRLFQKIIQKQIEVVNNLDYYLKQANFSGIRIAPQTKIGKVLKQMMNLDPENRISPFEVLKQFGVECEPQRMPFY